MDLVLDKLHVNRTVGARRISGAKLPTAGADGLEGLEVDWCRTPLDGPQVST